MSFIETIKQRARSDVKTIVLPESEDDRTILAAATVLAEGTADLECNDLSDHKVDRFYGMRSSRRS